MYSAEQFADYINLEASVASAHGVVTGAYAPYKKVMGPIDAPRATVGLYRLGLAVAEGLENPDVALANVTALRGELRNRRIQYLPRLDRASLAVKEALKQRIKGAFTEAQYWECITRTRTYEPELFGEHPHFGSTVRTGQDILLAHSLPTPEPMTTDEESAMVAIHSTEFVQRPDNERIFPIRHALQFEPKALAGTLVTLHVARIVDDTWPVSLTALLQRSSVEQWGGYAESV